MVPTSSRWSATVLAVLLAAPVFASELSLTIRDGRVTLVASDVSVREVLAEWARVGRVTIINGERLGGSPLTLRLEDVPEAEALASILRTASGYVLAPRSATVTEGSRFDRVLILPSSVPPPAADVAPSQDVTAGRRLPAFPRPVQSQPSPDEAPGPETPDDGPHSETATSPFGATQPGEMPAEVAPPGTPGSPLYSPVPGQIVQPAQEGRPGIPRVRLPGQQPSGQDIPRTPSE